VHLPHLAGLHDDPRVEPDLLVDEVMVNPVANRPASASR